MKNQINLAIQVIPSSNDRKVYDLVDEAIAVIQASGLRYQVCPFETVLEGDYDRIMEVVKQSIATCLSKGAEEILVNIKMQIKKDGDVTIEEKTGKY